MIAVRSELVDRDPSLPTKLYNAFAESKGRQVATDPAWTALPRLGRQAAQIAGDPIAYGLDANDASLRALVSYSREQACSTPTSPPIPSCCSPKGDYPTA